MKQNSWDIREIRKKMEKFPVRDYSDREARAAVLAGVPGHPLSVLVKENEALLRLLVRYRESRKEALLSELRQISIHYAKKGDLLYPLLKVKYGVIGPADVMWTEDDAIRDDFSALLKEKQRGADWQEKMDLLLGRMEQMVQRDTKVLFPLCAVNFTEEEWMGIYRDAKDYPSCLGVKQEIWQEAEQAEASPAAAAGEEIRLPGGHLTPEQLRALLNTIPMEITFVDGDNINRFFNEGPKVFKRPSMAIDRDVFFCHPPKVETMVRGVIEDFREGRIDSLPIWMEKNGRTMLVTYMAVRNSGGQYLGTVELVQDMEFAKEHFLKK